MRNVTAGGICLTSVLLGALAVRSGCRPDLTAEVLMVIWLATATWLDRSFGLLRRDFRQIHQISLSGKLKMSPLGAAIFSGAILFMAAFWVYKFYK